MSDMDAETVLAGIRWQETNGKAVCPLPLPDLLLLLLLLLRGQGKSSPTTTFKARVALCGSVLTIPRTKCRMIKGQVTAFHGLYMRQDQTAAAKPPGRPRTLGLVGLRSHADMNWAVAC